MAEQGQHIRTVCLLFAGHSFRVELGGEDGGGFVFDGFDDAVLRLRCGGETTAQGFDGLVMVGVGYHFLKRGDTSPWNTTACARVTEFKRGLKQN